MDQKWYAIRLRAQHESRASQSLRGRGLEVEVSSYSYTSEGTRVRIGAGAFESLEGYIQKLKNHDQLIISLHLLKRSVSVQLESGGVTVLQ